MEPFTSGVECEAENCAVQSLERVALTLPEFREGGSRSRKILKAGLT
jgi:hypothetical protein